MTPEGRVKKLVSSYLEDLKISLDSTGYDLYSTMFVPTGFGRRNQLDYTLCIYGRFVAIETKAPGEWLTPLQRQTCRSILRSGGKVFIISGADGLGAFKRWMDRQSQVLGSEHSRWQ